MLAEEETDTKKVTINEADVETQFYRDSGPGGQHRNKVETAVRLTHKPTGIVVSAADSRSQYQNRKAAWAKLENELNQDNVNYTERVKSSNVWVWCEWRDSVKSPYGKSAMKTALKGNLRKLIK